MENNTLYNAVGGTTTLIMYMVKKGLCVESLEKDTLFKMGVSE